MRLSFRYLEIVFLMLYPVISHATCVGVWTGASGVDDNWGTAGNWQSCIPEVQNDSALFSLSTGFHTVNVNIAPIISSLTFDNSSSFVLSGSGPLTFVNTTLGAHAAWTVVTGAHFLDVPIQLNNTQLDISINNSGSLTLENTLTDLSSSSIQLVGPGSFINSNNSQFSLQGNFSLLSGSFTNVNQTTQMSITMNELLILGGTLSLTNNLSISVINENGIAVMSNSGMVSGGVVNITNTGTIGADNSNGAEWTMSGDLQMTGGAITLNNQGAITAGKGCLLFSNTLELGGGTILLTNSGEVNGAFAQGATLSVLDTITMLGGNLINGESGPSQTAVNTSVVVPTFDLNGGTFINRSVAQINTLSINSSGILAGNGIFTSVSLAPITQITNSGTVFPGDPFLGGNPAVISIQGSYTQNVGGTLGLNFFDQNDFSQLRIAKTAQIAGNLELGLTPGFSILPGQTFVILQAAGGVTGTFNDPAPFCLLNPTLTYLPDAVEISFTPTMCSYVGEFIEMIFSSVNQENNFLLLTMEKLRMRSNCVLTDPDCNCQKEDKWSIYIGPVGAFGDVKTKGAQVGFGYWSAGVLTGFDYAFSQGGLGFTTEYERMSARADDHWGKFHVDYLHTNIYGTYYLQTCPAISFNSILGGGYQWYTFQRNLSPFFPDSVKGAPQGGEVDALLDVEFSFHNDGQFQFIPFVSVQYIYLQIGKFIERGVPLFDLAIDRQNANSLRSTLGLRGDYSWQAGTSIIFCAGSIGWQREFLDKARSISFLPLNFTAPNNTLSTVDASRNIFIGAIDLWIELTFEQTIEANYSFDWSSLYQDNFFYLSWNLKF